MTTLVEATEVAALIVGVGGAATVVQKGVKALRRLSRVADGILGDGSKEHPGVVAGQAELVEAIDALKAQATADLAEVKQDVAAVKAQTAAIERKLDDHVDTVAPSLLADGQAWGNKLDSEIADHEDRIRQLEQDDLK
jgi:hypothetical protein